ncbi:hypothetical protein N7468_007385 [Penicillium chermesinum]|uniref:Uncharacterized protein n=1 Tax=Penicillium chermesinum TaxID=63820 RepID=A0A9W9TM52_9EURO|nr:uncharacterized protein N7468_007385 [Penicillium chermesinum]KAJ5226160.1 hypothetical protein N7468_007385 [Penicillium chermesinum]KAJ6160656.1 hypothetical protein N7470_004052 [Penicillium chermesinum]
MGRPFNNSWPSANPKFHGPFNPRAEFPRNFTDSPSRNDRSHAVQQSQDHQGGSFQRKRWRGKRNRNWNGDWHGNQNRRNQHSSGWTSKDLELRLLAQPIQPSDLVTFDRIEIDAQGDVIMTDAPQAQTSSFNDVSQ